MLPINDEEPVPVVLKNIKLARGAILPEVLPKVVLGYVGRKVEENIHHDYVLKGKCVLKIEGWICECGEVFRSETDVDKHCEQNGMTLEKVPEEFLNDPEESTINEHQTNEKTSLFLPKRIFKTKRQQQFIYLASEKSEFPDMYEFICKKIGADARQMMTILEKQKAMIGTGTMPKGFAEISTDERRQFERYWEMLTIEFNALKSFGPVPRFDYEEFFEWLDKRGGKFANVIPWNTLDKSNSKFTKAQSNICRMLNDLE